MKTFQEEKNEIDFLNSKHKPYWEKEFNGRDYSDIISDPKNFKKNIFYHQANSEEDKLSILENGFDINRIEKSNRGAGKGFYLGRDKKVLVNFYNEVICGSDFSIKIVGDFIFFDTITNDNFDFNQANIEKYILEKGYDGIRYFDPDATGEEFVLFNLDKIQSLS